MTDRQGHHRSTEGHRGVSKGVIFAVIALIVVVALVVGWFSLRDRVSDESDAAAQTCVDGDAQLNVTADPEIASQLEAIANKYNETKPVVRDSCAHVAMIAKPSEAVRVALAAKDWDVAALGPKPALWIPSSSQTLNRVAAGVIDGDPKSIASSSVVLAVHKALADELTGRKAGWGDLPGLKGISVPLGPGSDSTLLASEAVAAAVANAGFGPLSEEAARSGPVVAALSQLVTNSTGKATDTAAALNALVGEADSVQAVAVTEHQLSSAGDKVVAYKPVGATIVADFPAATLNGEWVDETQSRIASMFVDFLRQPEQAKTLSDAGFRTGEVERSLQPAAGPVLDQLANVLAHPTLGANTTVLLDVSASMSNPLVGVVDALHRYVNGAGDSSGFGLWTYSKGLDGPKPYHVDVPLGPLNRNAANSALTAVRSTPVTTDQAYPTLIDAYRAAVAGFVAGRTNSVLLITDGPDDDSTVNGQQLLDAIAAATDPSKPVRVNVVALGAAPPQTLRSLADRTGGSVTTGPDAGAGIAKALTP
ncbi:substrate-binding domain-containing protein [Antrihabitans stalactiti]|uniref:VWA domain-containing protein n=1 Tax=Antrihabitans stalactiti TaxID=2584121 RepID=A0A848KGT4_9NOCA|nr:substrate-binding domain-containing protein [Antrihabitans stalactiti]NMN97381.1 VWA domain-containing protein [Antrihabitans stalactiti]